MHTNSFCCICHCLYAAAIKKKGTFRVESPSD